MTGLSPKGSAQKVVFFVYAGFFPGIPFNKSQCMVSNPAKKDEKPAGSAVVGEDPKRKE